MNLAFSFSVTTLLAIVISTATAQEQIYNQIHASRGAAPGASASNGGHPHQHQHHDHEPQQQQQQEQRTQQLRGGRGRHPSTSLLEAVKVDAGSCRNVCSTWYDDCCRGYTCQSVGSLFPHLACVPS